MLDRPTLDLTFRCLDELRDYHRDLRAQGQSDVDLSGSTRGVVDASVHATGTSPSPATQPVEASPAAPDPPESGRRPVAGRASPARAASAGIAAARAVRGAGPRSRVTVVFEPDLPLADMKARLVLNRLSRGGAILSTDPPVEQLDEVDPLSRFTVFLTADCDADELRAWPTSKAWPRSGSSINLARPGPRRLKPGRRPVGSRPTD